MAGSRIRVRLLFDDCTPSRLGSVGRRRCWFLLNSDACRFVTDVEYCIRETFCLGKSTQIELYLDDFVLPPFERSEIIRENDIIRVKLLGDIQRDSSPRQGQVPASKLSDGDTGNLCKKKRKKKIETVQNGGTRSEISSLTTCVSEESARTQKKNGRRNKEKKKECKSKQDNRNDVAVVDSDIAIGKSPSSTGQKQAQPQQKSQKIQSSKESTSSSTSSSSEDSDSDAERKSVRPKTSKLQNGVTAGKARKDVTRKVASRSTPNNSQPQKVRKVDLSSGSGTDDSDSSSTESSSTEEDDARMMRIKKPPLSETEKVAAVKDTRKKLAIATVGKPMSGKPYLPVNVRRKVPAKNNGNNAKSAVPTVGKSSSSITVKDVSGTANSEDTSSSLSSSSSDSEENVHFSGHDSVQGRDQVKDPSKTSTSLKQHASTESSHSTSVLSGKNVSVYNVRKSASKSKAGHVRFSSSSEADSDLESRAASSVSSISNSKHLVQSIRSTENKSMTKDGLDQVAMQCNVVPAEGSNQMDDSCSTPPSTNCHSDIQKRLQSLSGHHPPCPIGPSPRPTPETTSPSLPPKALSPKPPPRDYSSCPPLVGPPRLGDVIAYKILELSSSYTPEVSAYKEGEVMNVNHSTSIIELRLSDPSMGEEPSREGGRFELEDADADAGAEAKGEIGPQQPTVAPPASTVVSVALHSLIEPKLIT